jgi:hypothetical protein
MHQQLRNLLVGREALEGQLGEHGSPVDKDLEGPRSSGLQLHVNGFVLKRLLDFGGQTGRLGQVVSALAVVDADVHGCSLGLGSMAQGGAEFQRRNEVRAENNRREPQNGSG